MRIHITDSNCIEVLAVIEGETWAAQQRAHRCTSAPPYSVERIRRYVAEATHHRKAYPDSTLRELASDLASSSGLVIYGAGGWNRYGLDKECNVYPLPESFANLDKLALARTVLGVM